MYHIIVNLELACDVYTSFTNVDDPDCPEYKRGGKIATLKKLNDLINEDIDSWCHSNDTVKSLKNHYTHVAVEDEFNISGLLYELFLKYIPTNSTCVDVNLMDNHGNIVITIEE